MTTEKVNDLEIVHLVEYLEPRFFRLVGADCAHIHGGISEVPVYINLHPDFLKELTFDTKNLQQMFGFAIMGPKLRGINGGDYYSPARKGNLKSLELNDCGELWILKFEFFDGTKQLKAIKKEDVPPLLNYCRKPVLITTSGF